MAILNEDILKKDISSKKLAKTYLLFGNDSFLKKTYADKIINLSYDGDPFFNLQKFERDCDLQDVYNAVEQFPMMAESKCVCLDDYDFEHASAENFEKLCTLLESSHDECVLLLKFDGIEIDAKSSKFKKLIEATEKSGGKVIQLDHKKPVELVKTICDGATKRGAKIDASVAKYLIENCGTDLNILKNELDKLCFYTKNGIIDKAAVDEVSVKSIEESVYNLTKEIFDNNLTEALKILDGLFFMRIEPMIILYTISSSYVDIYRVSAGKKQGVGINTISETFKYPKNRIFVLERASRDLRFFDDKKLQLSFEALTNADIALKTTGSDSRIVLEQLIIRLIYILAKGEAVDKA